MVMKVCPRCNKIYPVNEYDIDAVHTCNSGITALDREDEVRIDIPNWNFQGAGNKASGLAKVKGKDIEDINEWGHRKSTHETRQHYEYTRLK